MELVFRPVEKPDLMKVADRFQPVVEDVILRDGKITELRVVYYHSDEIFGKRVAFRDRYFLKTPVDRETLDTLTPEDLLRQVLENKNIV